MKSINGTLRTGNIIHNKAIGGSTLYIYPEYGQGLYDTAPDFHDRILAFLE